MIRAIHRSCERGFTLVELMVALLIFSMIAASGTMLLSASVRTQDASGEKLQAMNGQRRLSAILTSDLAQAMPRISRNERGDNVPAFEALVDGMELRFVRSGLSNPAGLNRSSLQKLEYRLVEGRIERTAYAMVDGGERLEPAVLMEGVEQAQLRFRIKGEWLSDWPPEHADLLPEALELRFTRTGEDEMRMLFVVGAGTERPRVAAP